MSRKFAVFRMRGAGALLVVLAGCGASAMPAPETPGANAEPSASSAAEAPASPGSSGSSQQAAVPAPPAECTAYLERAAAAPAGQCDDAPKALAQLDTALGENDAATRDGRL